MRRHCDCASRGGGPQRKRSVRLAAALAIAAAAATPAPGTHQPRFLGLHRLALAVPGLLRVSLSADQLKHGPVGPWLDPSRSDAIQHAHTADPYLARGRGVDAGEAHRDLGRAKPKHSLPSVRPCVAACWLGQGIFL